MNNQQGNAAGAGKEDFLDKGKFSAPLPRESGQVSSDKSFAGVDAVEKKFGGGKIDPVKQRDTNEKVTDKARGFLEKKGINIPSAVGHELTCPLELLAVMRNADGNTVQQLDLRSGRGGKGTSGTMHKNIRRILLIRREEWRSARAQSACSIAR